MIYQFADYKEILRSKLLEKKKLFPKFNFQGMAKACGLQKAYLSRVFHDEQTHLSEEQALHAAQYLGFTEAEQEFLVLLRALQRAQTKTARAFFQRRLDEFRNRHAKAERYLASEALADDEVGPNLAYYLDPNMLLVHTFLAVPAISQDPRRLSAILGLAPNELQEIIRTLEAAGVIRNGPSGYLVTKRSLQLPSDSPVKRAFRTLSRVKALERIQRQSQLGDFDYSVFFTADPATAEAIRQHFLEFLSSAQKLVGKAKDEKVYQMNFDLLGWDT